jgi:hypothetical protein
MLSPARKLHLHSLANRFPKAVKRYLKPLIDSHRDVDFVEEEILLETGTQRVGQRLIALVDKFPVWAIDDRLRRQLAQRTAQEREKRVPVLV